MANYNELMDYSTRKSKANKAPVYYSRQYAGPMDVSEVFDSISALEEYLGGGIAYAGQFVAVVNGTDVFPYIIEYSADGSSLVYSAIGGDVKNPALSAETYSAATVLATAENIGQVVYVNTEETVEGNDKPYSAGPYIVTGAGQLAKLGTVSATDDLAGDVNAVKGDVGTLKTDVSDIKDILNGTDDSDGLVANVAGVKADVDSIKTDLDGNGDDVPGLKADVAGVRSDVDDLKAVLDGDDDNDGLVAKVDALAGAQANVIEEVQVNGVKLVPDENKAVNVVIPAADSYSIEEATDSGEYAKVYNFMKNDSVLTSINIPKDLVIKSGSIVMLGDNQEIRVPAQGDPDDVDNYNPAVYYPAGKYLKLVLNNDDKVFIAVGELVDAYTPGDTIVKVSNDNKISIDVDALKSNLGLGTAADADVADIVASVVGTDDDTADKDTIKGVKAMVADLETSLKADLISSVSGSNAISVSDPVDGAVVVSLKIATGDNAGNVAFTQTTDGLVGRMTWDLME